LPGALRGGMNLPEHLLPYPELEITKITIEDMAFIDLEGTFQWVDYDGIEHEIVKDKTTAPTSTDKSMHRNPSERIQVYKYMFDESFIPQASVESQFYSDNEQWAKNINIAWKPESKKPDSRLFGMCNDPDRRVLSVVEANIAAYLKSKPGSSVGMADHDLFKKMHELYNRSEIDTDKLMISFDLKAWSPQMSPDFKELMLKKWAIAFGKPHLTKIMKIFNERDLKVDKLGHVDSFKSIGVDIEGFNGKLNTDGHIDIMGYLAYKMRKADIFEAPVNFLALIDDGLMEVAVPNDKYDARVDKIVQVVNEGYPAFGHEISWDKTYFSRTFSMYLNEIVLDGQRITPGIKSYLKVGVPQALPVENLMDELMAHASTTRGAIKAGTDHNVAYDGYIIEYYISLKRWSGYSKLNVRDMVLRTFLPFSLSGFSINSIFSLSTNETFDTFESCAASCFIIGKVFPDIMPWFNKVFNRDAEEMDPGIMLRNPRSFHFGLKCLTNQRFASLARGVILKKSVHPYIREISRQIDQLGEFGFDGIISGSQCIHNVVRELLWKMDPRSVVETLVGKLADSNTAAMLIGYKRVLSLRMLYRADARKVINKFIVV